MFFKKKLIIYFLLIMECKYCHSKENLKKCGQCQKIYYCSKNCQISDWKNHKAICKIRLERFLFKNYLETGWNGKINNNFEILYPLKFTDCNVDYIKSINTEYCLKHLTQNINYPCPILIRFNNSKIPWIFPDKELIIGDEYIQCSAKQLRKIPTVMTWINELLFLNKREKDIAIEKNIRWEFLFTLYEFSIQVGYNRIIDEFWDISPMLENTIKILHLSENENIIEKYIKILNNLQFKLDKNYKLNEINIKKSLINKFIQKYYDLFLKKYYDISSIKHCSTLGLSKSKISKNNTEIQF